MSQTGKLTKLASGNFFKSMPRNSHKLYSSLVDNAVWEHKFFARLQISRQTILVGQPAGSVLVEFAEICSDAYARKHR